MRIRTSTYFAQWRRYVTDDGFGQLTIEPHSPYRDTIVIEGALRPRSDTYQDRCDYFMRKQVIGRIMPQVSDSRQQPKSLAERLIQKRVDHDKYCCDADDRQRRNRGSLVFLKFQSGTRVYEPYGNRLGGKCYGIILPTVSDEVLAASPGIQSWSKQGATNSPTS